MKKLLVLAVLLIAVIASGCGDKFAKEKEAITKAEQAAMAMKLPEVIVPYSLENLPGKIGRRLTLLLLNR